MLLSAPLFSPAAPRGKLRGAEEHLPDRGDTRACFSFLREFRQRVGRGYFASFVGVLLVC